MKTRVDPSSDPRKSQFGVNQCWVMKLKVSHAQHEKADSLPMTSFPALLLLIAAISS
jgi:hypothetical protein